MFLKSFGGVQSDEGAAVSLAQDPHQGGESFAGVVRSEPVLEHYRKSHRMDPDAPGTVPGDFVDSVHFVDYRLDSPAAEFISENIEAYFFIRGIKCINRRGDSLDRAAVAEGSPDT